MEHVIESNLDQNRTCMDSRDHCNYIWHELIQFHRHIHKHFSFMHVVGHFRALCSVLAFSELRFFLLPKYPVVVTYREDLYRCQGLSQFSSLAALSLVFVLLILNIGEMFQLNWYIYKYIFFQTRVFFYVQVSCLCSKPWQHFLSVRYPGHLTLPLEINEPL